jgi:Tol biopolymer transport system component
VAYLEGPKNNYGIYRSEFINGEYLKPEPLPSSINMANRILNWTPFIAADESYLLFSSNRRSPNTEAGDLYVCFRRADGNWTNPISLGEPYNTDRQERFPAVSPDGKYLFFTRWILGYNQDVFWVSAKIIDRLREENKIK